ARPSTRSRRPRGRRGGATGRSGAAGMIGSRERLPAGRGRITHERGVPRANDGLASAEAGSAHEACPEELEDTLAVPLDVLSEQADALRCRQHLEIPV